ncbi:MAG: hypothetical protein VR65_16625 [Desulfobulbaceae bacterium BRH_c16a]|nr:MAG: hypothetical protein VR65_16625 [Desulfobulbaceae bacterium BRH_c16a]
MTCIGSSKRAFMTLPRPNEVAANNRFSTAAAELWISMVRKKSKDLFCPIRNSSLPWLIRLPVFFTPMTTGALARVLAAMRTT